MKPLPKPAIEGHDWELWGQNVVSDLYTEQQMQARDAEWEKELLKFNEELASLAYLYLSLTDAMGYESSSGLSPEEWAERLASGNKT